ncbi:MAG: heparinase [Rhodobacteraceae bacterium]|nr:MAG: heparinase [Paracoccaceae bacterium]
MSGLGRNAAAAIALARRRLRAAGDGLAARRAAAFARPSPLSRPVEPLTPGDAEAAARVAGGAARFAGRAARIGAQGPWAAQPPSEAWRDAMHGFQWLDDAAAAERPVAAVFAGWLSDWMRRYGGGSGGVWRPDLAGRRLARLAAAPAVIARLAPRDLRRLARVVGVHHAFLDARWRKARTPLGRLEAATGLALGALAAQASRRATTRAAQAVGEAAAALIAADGGVASRKPDDLAQAFDLLAWTAHAFAEAGVEADPRHEAALGRAGPALRTLRLGDGGLARFHGGGGADMALDQALALAGSAARGPAREAAMGYHRLAAGGTVVLMDAAAPPRDAPEAGASALAFEIAAGRRRLIGSVGPGRLAGGEWAVAARATAAHSGVEIAGVSLARIAPGGYAARAFGRPLVDGPGVVAIERAADLDGLWALGEHDGYAARFGLIVSRRLNLSVDGATLRGEETLAAPTAEARRRFDAAADSGGVPFVVRFHVAPDVEAAPGRDPALVILTPPSGPAWAFRASTLRPRIVESVWIDESGRPRPTRQIVVASRAEAYFGRVVWSLHRERGGGNARG